MKQLKKGDQVALVALSNGLSLNLKEKIEALEESLKKIGLEVIRSPYLFAEDSIAGAIASVRAMQLMAYYKEKEIQAVFDVSGGDIANEVLTLLDYELIKQQDKIFFGYSDLTTVINALYTCSGKSSCLYQIRNMVGTYGKEQQRRVEDSLLQEKADLLSFNYKFLQKDYLEGVVIGGNIRCFLKLAGTPYMPDFKDKVLFLESRSGGPAQMITFLNQYKQMGAFKQIKGLILGNFTQMESEGSVPSIEELVMQIVDRTDLPIVKTSEIGHGADSKAILIGENITLGA